MESIVLYQYLHPLLVPKTGEEGRGRSDASGFLGIRGEGGHLSIPCPDFQGLPAGTWPGRHVFVWGGG